ncbi:MAG: hypothetical protein ABLQ96_06830 [Candidatus Acidiferrum sp.]
MKHKFFALLMTLAFLAVVASAHGDKKHVIGTIEKLEATSVTIKTRDGKSVEVKLVSSTAYIKRVNTVDTPAVLSDLAVGENVVVHATPKGDDLEADEVRFSTGAPARSATPKP